MSTQKTFRDYGIDAPGVGTGQYYTTCPSCSHTRKKKNDKCLSVNYADGTWNCHHCGEFSGRLPQQKVEIPMRHSQPQPAADDIAGWPATGPLTTACLEWLAARGIPQEVAEAFGLQMTRVFFPALNAKSEAVAVPFYRDGEIVNWKYRAITGKAFSQSKGGEQCLYNLDGVRGKERIFLTEGEADCWALAVAGFDGVCSCPNGAPPPKARDLSGKLAFLDDAADVFEAADEVVLCMDRDEPGILWEEAIADRIGREKCSTVTYASDCKDANEVLVSYGVDTLRECIEHRTPLPVAGITDFGQHADEVEEYYANGGASRGLSTGWGKVDDMLRLRTQCLYILTGMPSSGKSEWLDQLVLNTTRLHGWKWAMFSPENYPPVLHFQKLAEKLVGKPMFARWSVPPMAPDDVDRALAYLAEHIDILTFDDRGTTLDSLLSRLKVCVRRHGVKGFVLDPYNELEHQRPSALSETEYIGQFLSKVRNFGRLFDVAMFVVAHPTKPYKRDDGSYPCPTPYDISGSANWRNKADVALAVHRDIRELGSFVEIHVQKVRDKNQGRTGRIDLHWQAAMG